jgi:adenosylhomocysteine nucleosidase
MAAVLVVAPQSDEAEGVCRGLAQCGVLLEASQVGLLKCTVIPSLDMLVAVGGNGKAQFAVQCQHLLEHCPRTKFLVCAGAAGRLHPDLCVGDIVVATCSIEHDYRERFIPEPLPRHECDADVVGQIRSVVAGDAFPFRVQFGPIASGDEDIVDLKRSVELQAATGALCVAWEGSGGARAARFSGVGFVELRVITDDASADAAQAFHENLGLVLPNIGRLLYVWQAKLLPAV